MGHSMSDPIHGHYRTREEVEDQRKRDPIAVWSQRLHRRRAHGRGRRCKAMDKEVIQEVEDAYQFADQAPDPEPEELYKDVYAEPRRRDSVNSEGSSPANFVCSSCFDCSRCHRYQLD